MKVALRAYGVRQSTIERQNSRAQAADIVRTRGTGKVPGAPRDVFVQTGPRGILVNWLPPAINSDIFGWRVYKDDETKLFAELKDAKTTQHFIEANSGTTPPATNIFVSSVNALGIESAKIQVQGVSAAEAGAPVMPVTPPTYTTPYTVPTGSSGGGRGFGRA